MVDDKVDEQKTEGDKVHKAGPEEAVALYDYKAGTDKELSFSKGDNLRLYSKVCEKYC